MSIVISLIFVSFALFGLLSYAVSRANILLSKKLDIVDNPLHAPERKFQTASIPLATFTLSYCVLLVCISVLHSPWIVSLTPFTEVLQTGMYLSYNIWAILIGAMMLLIAGVADDAQIISPRLYTTSIFLSLAVIVFLGGVRIEAFSYPFDMLPVVGSWWVSRILGYIWLLCCVSAIKFLDGMDGLVTSVGMITFFTIGYTATQPHVYQPLIVFISLLWVFSLSGFFPLNKPHAKAYLGEGGATAIGLWIGILSILSGAKVATTFSVVGWFVIDILCVMIYRLIRYGFRFSSLLRADAYSHWHHRLLRGGLTKSQTLACTAALLTVSAFAGIMIPTEYKASILCVQLVLIIGSFWYSLRRIQSKKTP